MELGAVIKHDLKKAPKTGDWRYMKPQVLEEKCTACEACIPFCPEAAIDLVEVKSELNENDTKQKLPARIATRSVAGVDYDFCKGCGVCADVCPQKAIIMTKNK